MKKITLNKIWIAIGITAAFGVLLSGFGFILGANTGGIHIGSGGLRFGTNALTQIQRTHLDAFDNISINVTAINVRIVTAEYFGFEARYREHEGFYQSFGRGRFHPDTGGFLS